MGQLQERERPEKPKALATDGKGSYREAMLKKWRRVHDYAG